MVFFNFVQKKKGSRFDISFYSSNFPFFKVDIVLLFMLVSCVVYSPSFYDTSEPSLSSFKALGIVKENKAYFTKIVYRVLFSIILSMLFKH